MRWRAYTYGLFWVLFFACRLFDCVPEERTSNMANRFNRVNGKLSQWRH